MANKLYIEQDIQNIANSIRTKNGLSTLYKVSEMSSAINNLTVLSEGTITGTTNTQVSLSNVVKDKELNVDGKAEQNGTPSPDSPQEISVVESMSVNSVGKNLFDVNNYTLSDNRGIITINNDNSFILTSSLTTSYINTRFFVGKVTSNKITVDFDVENISGNSELSWYIRYTDTPTYDSSFPTINQGNNNHIVLDTSDKIGKYLWVHLRNNLGSPTVEYSKKFKNFMVVNGDYTTETIKPYEPYKGITTPINLQGNFLGALPNGVKDELKIVNGNASIIKRVGKVVLDGSESWSYNSPNSVFYLANFIDYVFSSFMPISNYYQGQASVSGYGNVNNKRITTLNLTENNRLLLKNTDLVDINALKSWLSTHNTIVYYELATPTTIDLGRVPILTIDGTNNLTIYANLNTNFSLKYGKVI